jgi:hypothetical protein
MEAKERSTTRKNIEHVHFYMDMRFWLILLMLAAFVSFLVS